MLHPGQLWQRPPGYDWQCLSCAWLASACTSCPQQRGCSWMHSMYLCQPASCSYLFCSVVYTPGQPHKARSHMQQHVQASNPKHPLAEKLGTVKARGKKVATARRDGAVQKKQAADSPGTLKRAQAIQSSKKAVTPSPKRKASEAAIVTPAKKDKAERIRKQLVDLYPNPPIPLIHQSDFQLLIAVMLSAQVCTPNLKQLHYGP